MTKTLWRQRMAKVFCRLPRRITGYMEFWSGTAHAFLTGSYMGKV